MFSPRSLSQHQQCIEVLLLLLVDACKYHALTLQFVHTSKIVLITNKVIQYKHVAKRTWQTGSEEAQGVLRFVRAATSCLADCAAALGVNGISQASDIIKL